MRRFLSLALISSIGLTAFATSADAQYYQPRTCYGHPCGALQYYRQNNNGTAVVAGVLGLVVGAALASGQRQQPAYVVREQPRVVYVEREGMDAPAPVVSRWFLEIPGGSTRLISEEEAVHYHCWAMDSIAGGRQMHCTP